MDYTEYGIKDAILIDNTGRWRDREGLSQHLRPGIAKVVLTAPGKGDVPNIVHGVNHDTIKPDEQIMSCASCTTNAIVPPLKAMADEYGVLRGHVETVHSFTNDQNLLDNYHNSDRRGRSAPLNMVITETGAASAVAKALPDLKAKITGSSIRVPVPDVSIAILNLQLARETTREEVLDHLRDVSLTSPLKRQIDFISAPDAVSSDFIGSRHASIRPRRRDPRSKATTRSSTSGTTTSSATPARSSASSSTSPAAWSTRPSRPRRSDRGGLSRSASRCPPLPSHRAPAVFRPSGHGGSLALRGELLADAVQHERGGFLGAFLPGEDARGGDAVEVQFPECAAEGVPVDLALAPSAAVDFMEPPSDTAGALVGQVDGLDRDMRRREIGVVRLPTGPR